MPMFVRRAFTAMLLAGCCVLTHAAQAQVPDLQYLHPAGGTSGRTFEVELAGTKLDDVQRLHFSHAKISAKSVGERRAEVTIAADVPPGECDAWAVSATGISAPVRFVVSALPVVAEKEPNHRASQAHEIEGPTVVYGRIEPGTDIDWYRVKVPKGANLGVTCRSVSIGGTALPTIGLFGPNDPENADELAHDWMQRTEPCLYLYRDYGETDICYVRVQDRSYRTTPAPIYELSLTTGPLLLGMYPPCLTTGPKRKVELYGYNLPGDTRLRDVTVTGGMFFGDLIKRVDIELDVAPHASGDLVRPSSTVFSTFSANRHPKFAGSATYESLSGPILDFAAPESELNESHDEHRRKVAEPRRITPPVVLTHRFHHPFDTVHWYRFPAKKDQMFWLEAVSLQPGRPRDLELIVHDAKAAPLEAFNDVAFAKSAAPIVPLESRDPSGLWKAPVDGDYLLAVRDRFGHERHAFERSYRLSVGPRLEGVRVVAVMGEAAAPRGWSVAAGGKLEVTLAALRRGGQEAGIDVSVEEGSIPAGLKIAPTTIAAGKPTGTLTIEAAKDATPSVMPIRFIAKTTVNGKPTTMPVETVVYVRGDVPARLCAQPVIAVMAAAKK